MVTILELFGHKEKTVKRITKKLENAKILESKRVAHGKKIYKISDIQKAIQFRDAYITGNLLNKKNKPKIGFSPISPNIIKKPTGKLSSYYLFELWINGKIQKKWQGQKIQYRKKICPLCAGKLINFKHGKVKQITHDLDKKCANCKSKFLFNEPSSKNTNDGKIIIEANENVQKFLKTKLIDDKKMKLWNSRGKDFLIKINPDYEKFFEKSDTS